MGLDNPLHIAFLIFVLLLLFGAKRIPGMARDLGTGMREFKEGILNSPPVQNSSAIEQPPAQAPAQTPQQPPAPAVESQPTPHQSL
jgi:sec-independent protein translocase protein TatA